HRVLQFGEHRGWLVHGCAGNHGGAFPGGEGLPVPVVAGDHRVVVAGIVQVADFLDARQRSNLPAAAERLVHPLSRMRQERGEHGVQVIDGLGGGVQYGALALRVFLQLPRGSLGQVAVDLPHQAHRLVDGAALAVGADLPADLREPGLGVGQDAAVGVGQFTGGGDGAEVLVDQVGGAVDQVAPAGHQFVVGAALELRPGEVRVVRFGAGDGDEVPQRIGLIAGEHVPHVNDHAAGGGELPALHGQELTGDHLGGQL